MGASGPARVVHIGPAPPLEAGPGQIVTGTFAHSAANVINLYVEGLDEPIGTTASHPFWCEDRQAFVPAGDLKRGERLRTQDGQLLALTASRPRAAAAVFNLEVNTEHVYYVGIHGLLVHNSCSDKGVAPNTFRGGSKLKARLGVDVKKGADGLVHPLGKNGKPQGLSLNIDPKDKFIQQYGGAFSVKQVPDGLQIVQSGRPGHYVISPTKPMSFEQYQGLLDQVQLGTFNTLP